MSSMSEIISRREIFPFNRLPCELRRQVLLQTTLVLQDDDSEEILPDDNSEGINIHDGKLVGSASWIPLFKVSRQMYIEALHIFLSENWFVFTGDVGLTSTFFLSHTSWINHLKMIEFNFESNQIWKWNENRSHKSWKALVGCIKSNFSLSYPRLWVTINAGDGWHDYQNATEYAEYAYAQDFDPYYCTSMTYKQIIRPWQHMKDLRKFHAYFSLFGEYEAEAEKEVMGDKYDSLKDGKNPSDPEGPISHADFW